MATGCARLASSGTYVNRSFYCLSKDKKGRTVIISFDTSNELFRVSTAWEDILASTKMRVYICTLE